MPLVASSGYYQVSLSINSSSPNHYVRVLVDGQPLGSGVVNVPVSGSPANVVVGSVYLTAGQHGLIVEGQYTSNNDYGDNSCGFTNMTLTPIHSETYTQWAAGYFNSAQQANPTISGPNGTPQSDGVPNLLKYLFDIDPARPMTPLDRGALPVAGTAVADGTRYLTLTYRQSVLATSISPQVQTSSDLVNWAAVSSANITQSGVDPNTGDPIMQARVAAGGLRQFLRLQAMQP